MAACRRLVALVLVSAAGAGACNDATAPDPPRTLSLSVTAMPVEGVPFSATTAEATAAGLEQSDGAHTLVISSVELVVRRIELSRADTTCSDDDDDDDNDHWRRFADCEELKLGPVLVNVPLDGAVERVFAVQLPEGSYRGVELQIHKPSLGNESDLTFLRDHPLLEGVSILVEGTFDGDAFTFVQRVEAKERYALDPPLLVNADSEPTNLTIHLDVSTWFLDSGGGLVDPVSANRGGANEAKVRRSILESLNAFTDDDRDGVCDRRGKRG